MILDTAAAVKVAKETQTHLSVCMYEHHQQKGPQEAAGMYCPVLLSGSSIKPRDSFLRTILPNLETTAILHLHNLQLKSNKRNLNVCFNISEPAII